MNRNISKLCKDLIQKVCHLNKDKRYDFSQLLSDPIITSYKSQQVSQFDLSEFLCEKLIKKVRFVLDFYKNENSKINNCLHTKESLTLICIYLIEIKHFTKFFSNKFGIIDEVYVLAFENDKTSDFKFFNGKYEQISKFSPKVKNSSFSQENIEKLKTLEIELTSVFKHYYHKDKDFSVNDLLDNLFSDLNAMDLEAHFFNVFEVAMNYFTKNSIEKAKEHFEISKIYYELIILIRTISSDMNLNCEFDLIMSNKEFNIGEHKDVLFTFLGNLFKKVASFEQISERYQTESYLHSSNKAFETLVSFYGEINKMLEASSKI